MNTLKPCFRKTFLPTLIGLLTLIVPGTSFAADPAACNAYGLRAAQQHRDNLAMGCGFQDLRWTDNVPAAYIFCMTFGEGAAGAETSARDQLLNQCRAQKAAEAAANGGVAGDGIVGGGDGNAGGRPEDDVGGGNGGGNGGALDVDFGNAAGDNFGNGGGAQPEVDGVAPKIEIIPAGLPSPGNNCQPSLTSGLWGDTRALAIRNAQAGWEDQARTRYGNQFASFDGAREASFQCSLEPQGHYCVATGRPCDNVRVIEPNDPNERVCKGQAHRRERWFEGDYRQDFHRWMVSNWEYEVAQIMGHQFARHVDAINPGFTCSPTNTGQSCRIQAIPCSYPNRPRPPCVPVYRMTTNQTTEPMGYWDLKLEWSRRVATLYGYDYGNWDNAIARAEDEWRSNGSTIFAGAAAVYRYVEAQACLPPHMRGN